MNKKELNKKLFGGELVFDKTNRMSYKLDKGGCLIFNCVQETTFEERLNFTIGALINLGLDVDDAKAQAAKHLERTYG